MGYVGKHRKIPRKRAWLRGLAIFSVAALVIGGAGLVYLYRHLEGNITEIGLRTALGQDRPEKEDRPKQPLNVLVLGSDSREGQSDVLGDTPGLNDVTILLHLSADRERAYGISIPRDLMVQRPECPSRDGGEPQPASSELDLWNAAYAVGGPVCTVKQFEEMTDIFVDHVVDVDFTGFRSMVDALGGVEICVPEEINDTEGDIYLRKGRYEVNGREALDYVRVRKVISSNGDLGRMKRQQAFLASMVEKAVSTGTLLNPVKLVRFLDAATKSLTTDKELANLGALRSLAGQVRGIGLDRITFLTMPLMPYEPDPNRLAAAPEAEVLWRAVRLDNPLGQALRREGTTADAERGDPDGGTQLSEEDRAVREANGLCL